MPTVALYIHWPFCLSKCPYCDFNSHVREAVDEEAWRIALLRELETMAAWMPNATLTSIFFGGGTPSLMPPSITEALIEKAHALFACDETIEMTLEANPTSVESERFRDFQLAGINRVSLGVQSLRDDDLLFLERHHSSKEALKAVEIASQCFRRYSFDLIYARPNQTISDWEVELKDALRYADKHLSLYQLTIEPNTVFHHLYHDKKTFKLPKDNLSRELFLLTQQIMQDAGLPAYEISNHASDGEASRHNLSYWTGGAYLGVGAGAHGRVNIDGAWHATSTLKSPERWLERTLSDGHGLEQKSALTGYDRAQERVITGLRLREGLDISDTAIREIINWDKVAQYQSLGLLEKSDTRLRATHEGWLVLNHLLGELL